MQNCKYSKITLLSYVQAIYTGVNHINFNISTVTLAIKLVSDQAHSKICQPNLVLNTEVNGHPPNL